MSRAREREEAAIASVLSQENVRTAAGMALGYAALHVTAHIAEAIVVFSSTGASDFLRQPSALQRIQLMQYKACATLGSPWAHYVGDVTFKEFQQLPAPSLRQLSALRLLHGTRVLATGAGVTLLCVQVCLSYQNGRVTHEAAVSNGAAAIPSLASRGSVHRLYASGAPPSSSSGCLVLRLGTAREVTEMLSAQGPAFRPLPVLVHDAPFSSSSSPSSHYPASALGMAVQRASGGLASGCYLSFDFVADRLPPLAPSPSPQLIVQSGGQGSSPTAALLLLDALRRARPSLQAVAVHVQQGQGQGQGQRQKGRGGAEAEGAEGAEGLAWASDGVLSVDGQAALLCGLLGWIRHRGAREEEGGDNKQGAVLATSTAAPAKRPASPLASPPAPRPPPSPEAPMPSRAVEGAGDGAGSVEPFWFVVESVGGAVRTALGGARDSAALLSSSLGAAWLVGWGNVIAWGGGMGAALGGLGSGLVVVVRGVPGLAAGAVARLGLGRSGGSGSGGGGRASANRPVVVLVDVGRGAGGADGAGAAAGAGALGWLGALSLPGAHGWLQRQPEAGAGGGAGVDGVASALLRGLRGSGLEVIVCAGPQEVQAQRQVQRQRGREAVVLVRRAEAQGGDVASMQAARRYCQGGLRACAVTDLLSFDQLEQTAPAPASSAPASSAASSSGSALTVSTRAIPALAPHSFCVGRVAPGLWAHCSARLAAGVPAAQVASEMRADMAALLAPRFRPGNSPTRRAGHSMLTEIFSSGGTRLVVFGGRGLISTGSIVGLNDVWSFDTRREVWSSDSNAGATGAQQPIGRQRRRHLRQWLPHYCRGHRPREQPGFQRRLGFPPRPQDVAAAEQKLWRHDPSRRTKYSTASADTSAGTCCCSRHSAGAARRLGGN